jgi:NTP pyrophosphatase (non-canonical NTP hydrolase)
VTAGDEIADWHADKYGIVGLDIVALKLAEEVGEVAATIVKGEGIERLREELGDVAIVLAAIAGRFTECDIDDLRAIRFETVRMRS